LGFSGALRLLPASDRYSDATVQEPKRAGAVPNGLYIPLSGVSLRYKRCIIINDIFLVNCFQDSYQTGKNEEPSRMR
jgi:hypothetical protein